MLNCLRIKGHYHVCALVGYVITLPCQLRLWSDQQLLLASLLADWLRGSLRDGSIVDQKNEAGAELCQDSVVLIGQEDYPIVVLHTGGENHDIDSDAGNADDHDDDEEGVEPDLFAHKGDLFELLKFDELKVVNNIPNIIIFTLTR